MQGQHVCFHFRVNRPASDVTGKDEHYECDIRNVGHSELVWAIRLEPPLSFVDWMGIGRFRPGRERCTSLFQAHDSEGFHYSGHLNASDRPAMASFPVVHFLHPIHPIFLSMEGVRFLAKNLGANRTIRQDAWFRCPKSASRRESSGCHAQDATGSLGPDPSRYTP